MNETSVNETSVNETGLVYQCPLTPGSCTGVFGNGTWADKRLFDDERTSTYKST